jgi:hypothetical protein
MLTGLPAQPEQAQSGEIVMPSQEKREPMLLFEFDAALFQFEQREPELTPLFQLPPRRDAF